MVDRKKVIDLDNLEIGQEKIEAPAQDLGLGGLPVAQPRKGGVQEMYDKYKKQAFLFDISGSMGDGMLPDEIEKMYHWTDTIQEKFLTKLKEDMRKNFALRYVGGWDPEEAVIDAKIAEELQKQTMQQLMLEVDEDELEDPLVMQQIEEDAKDAVNAMAQEEKDNVIFFLTYGMEPYIGIALKMYIIRQSLPSLYNIKLVPTGVQGSHMRKIDVMKQAANQFIEERFRKNADAQVLAYQFDDYTELMTQNVTKDGLIAAVQTLHPRGGTNIYLAIDTTIKEFKRAPSAMALHHVVLVTDSETNEGMMIEHDLLPKLKVQGIVLDFIHIVGTGMWVANFKDSTDALKRVCKATGGDFIEVNTPSEFNQKFLKAASRLLIPAKV